MNRGGNLESLPDIDLYSKESARAVHVAVQGIAEALDKVYTTAARSPRSPQPAEWNGGPPRRLN